MTVYLIIILVKMKLCAHFKQFFSFYCICNKNCEEIRSALWQETLIGRVGALDQNTNKNITCRNVNILSSFWTKVSW